MPTANVSMKARPAGDGVMVIDIHGEITAFCEGVISEAYADAAQPGVRSIVLNFEGLQYMNSGGIGLLVTMLIRAQRGGQALSAFGLNDHYREIFSLTRLDEAIAIHETETAALAS